MLNWFKQFLPTKRKISDRDLWRFVSVEYKKDAPFAFKRLRDELDNGRGI